MVSMKRELTFEKYQKVMLCIFFLTSVVSWYGVIQLCDMRSFGFGLILSVVGLIVSFVY